MYYFPLYSKLNQLYVNMYPLSLKPPSHPPSHLTHLGHHRALSWAPCPIQPVPTSYLFYLWAVRIRPSQPPDSSPTMSPLSVSTEPFSKSVSVLHESPLSQTLSCYAKQEASQGLLEQARKQGTFSRRSKRMDENMTPDITGHATPEHKVKLELSLWSYEEHIKQSKRALNSTCISRRANLTSLMLFLQHLQLCLE